MSKYRITLTIETKSELKFPRDAMLLEELEHEVYGFLNSYVEFEPSKVEQLPVESKVEEE